MRACEVCGVDYEARRAASKFCGDRCRKRSQRAARSPAPSSSAPKTRAKRGTRAVPPAGTGQIEGAVERAVRQELEDAGRAATPLGVQVLLLARRLDGSTREPLQAVASLQKRLAEALSEATAGAKRQSDALDGLRDEIAERRERRRRAG